MVCAAFSQTGSAAEPRSKHVLLIGIDGVRTDAFKAANVPNLHQLVQEGAMSENTSVLGNRRTGADTLSGPGWSALLTGVWADKHGVKNNSFQGANYTEYPHFFKRLKEARPGAVTISVGSWPPFHDLMVSGADVSMSLVEKEDYAVADARVATEAARLLREKNPDAMFVYFGNVDVAGHAQGFHPTVRAYMQALEQVDYHVGALLSALRSRPSYAQEDWLILVATDHGGTGTGHERGRQFDEVRTVFLIVSGPTADRGEIRGTTQLVDVPATALAHLGVNLDPAWRLDGRAVGLKSR